MPANRLVEATLLGLGLTAVTYAATSAVETGVAFLRLAMNSPNALFLDMKQRLDEIKDGLRELEAKQDEMKVYLSISKTDSRTVNILHLKEELESYEHDYREYKAEYLEYESWRMLSQEGVELYDSILDLSVRVKQLNANFLARNALVIVLMND